jgi:Cu(I)/Ag(I) efflux system membrane fusion protein
LSVPRAVIGCAGQSEPPHAGPAGHDERQVLYWRDPMVPNARFDKPGKSPFMDMQLVPVYADETGGAQPLPSIPS